MIVKYQYGSFTKAGVLTHEVYVDGYRIGYVKFFDSVYSALNWDRKLIGEFVTFGTAAKAVIEDRNLRIKRSKNQIELYKRNKRLDESILDYAKRKISLTNSGKVVS